jgi:hypothetical protein
MSVPLATLSDGGKCAVAGHARKKSRGATIFLPGPPATSVIQHNNA